MAKLPIGVQLYTVRDKTEKDFPGTLKALARIGYKGVVLAGYGNLKSAGEVKKALTDAGLQVCGAHVGIEALEADLNKVLDEHELLGNRFIVIPWMDEKRRKDAAGWKQVAQSLNRIGASCRERGFTLCYHNHSFEFEKFDGKTGLDILWENSDANLVKSELDLFWVKHGGADPAAYLSKLGARAPLVHLKDMTPDRKFAEVGNGTIDWRPILDIAVKNGAKWGIVEQDDCYGKPTLDAVRTSFENLKKIGAV